MEYQTILWHKPTGKIIAVFQNKYIGRRSDLHILAPDHPIKEVAFFYEHQPIDISELEDRVKQIVSGNPPVVISPEGVVKSFAAWAHHRRMQISSANDILCHFEGGLGDQIMQAEAVHQFYEIFPEKRLTITVALPYYPLVKTVQGLDHVFPRTGHVATRSPDFSLDMHTPYISDPRGGLFGKASLYGASLGLKSVHKKIILQIPPGTIKLFDPPGIHATLKTTNLKIGIHIRSGSGHGKSWNTEPAERLASMFIRNQDALLFLFGKSNDWQMNNSNALKITETVPWLQTAAIIERLDLLYCIDSGPMHLARTLGTKHIILWGGTSYRDILGREREDHDARLDLPCIDQLCYDCPKGVPICMNGHDPDILYQKGLSYVQPIAAPSSAQHDAAIGQAAGQPP
jgi:ADP-heptose:LPS heptosyltransferase